MKYFVANWKMNMTSQDVLDWVTTWGEFNVPQEKQVIIAPTALHAPLLRTFNGIKVAAQNVSHLEKGAHTGEMGAFQAKEFFDYSIVGHSERQESKEVITKKITACKGSNLTPIVCFTNLEDVEDFYSSGVVLTWEDKENISKEGVYNLKEPQKIEEGIKKLKQILPEEAEIMYGGSVNKDNIESLSKIAGLDGVLVGNASLDPNHFCEIVNKG